MNRLEHLLTISGEECNEVAQRTSKAVRFGLRECQRDQPFNNAERIRQEYVDLVAVLSMVEQEAGLLVGDLTRIKPGEIKAKQDKVERYLLISAREGTLNEPHCQARQHSDEMVCGPCNLRWDINDPSPPLCLITRRR